MSKPTDVIQQKHLGKGQAAGTHIWGAGMELQWTTSASQGREDVSTALILLPALLAKSGLGSPCTPTFNWGVKCVCASSKILNEPGVRNLITLLCCWTLVLVHLRPANHLQGYSQTIQGWITSSTKGKLPCQSHSKTPREWFGYPAICVQHNLNVPWCPASLQKATDFPFNASANMGVWVPEITSHGTTHLCLGTWICALMQCYPCSYSNV